MLLPLLYSPSLELTLLFFLSFSLFLLICASVGLEEQVYFGPLLNQLLLYH